MPLSEELDIRVRIEYDYICSVESCNDLHHNWCQWISRLRRGDKTTDWLIAYCINRMISDLCNDEDYEIKTIVNHKLTDYTILE